jgi:malonate decarboxylase alpha subunit
VLHDLHVVQSGIVLPEHIDLFEKGIAKKLDYSYSGPQGAAVARALNSGKIQLGAIHTYIELFARYFVDLTPHVALTVARSADRQGNLYMGPNTEDSPAVIEATAFKGGVVVAQVNEMVDKLPRVDIPGDRVDFVVVSPNVTDYRSRLIRGGSAWLSRRHSAAPGRANAIDLARSLGIHRSHG